ncbi:MAG: PAS domain-containing protein [Myxococcales bacterium]
MSSGRRRLELILVEDSEQDASELLEHLRRNGFDVEHRRVQTREAMDEALRSKRWDLVISAYVLPRFSGPEAVELARRSDPFLPILMVSGKVGEEAAVDSMHAGAKDFILKSNLSRLVPAIERELGEADVRRERQRLRREAEANQRLVEAIVANVPACIAVIDGATLHVRWANEAMRQALEQLVERPAAREGASPAESLLTSQSNELTAHIRSVAQSGAAYHDPSFRLVAGPCEPTFWHLALVPLPREGEGEPAFDVILLAVDTTEIVHERERADSERARLQTLIETMPLGVLLTDAKGRFRLANPEALQVLGGLTGDAFGPATNYRLFRADGTPYPREELPLARALFRHELVRDARLVVRKESGKETIVSASASPILGPSGSLVGAVATLQDVTEQVRIEQKLRESEARLDAFFTGSPVALAIVDEQLRYLRSNPIAAEIFGAPPERIVGESVEQVGPAFVRAAASRLREVLRTGKPQTDIELSGTLPSAPRAVRHWLSSHFPIVDRGGTRGLGMIAVEVTDRVRAERRLQFLADAGSVLASSLDYTETVERVAWLAVPEIADWCFVDLLENDGVFRRVAVAHADPSMDEVAKRFRRAYRARPEAPLGVAEAIVSRRSRLLTEIANGDLVALAQDAEHLALLRAIDPKSYISTPLVARGELLGAISFVLSNGTASRYGLDELRLGEELARRVALAVDNARLYSEAQRAKDARERFINIVSHELRNPLSTIQAGIHLLRRALGDQNKYTLDLIERAVNLQSRLVDDLLDVARATRGKLLLRMAPVRLDTVVSSAVEAQRVAAQSAEIDLGAEIEPELWVQGDADRLQQAVLNLLTNAIKFTEPGHRIRVRLSEAHGAGPPSPNAPTGRRAWIEVQDEGIGIPREVLPRIFGLFEQAGTAPQRKAGLGIGLAMVKSIAEKHGGRVWAESEGPGTGSRFVIELPLIEPPEPSALTTSEAPAEEATVQP